MTWIGLHPPYSTIVIDPPWRYGTHGVTSTAKRDVYGHYSDLSNAEIAALPELLDRIDELEAALRIIITRRVRLGLGTLQGGEAQVDEAILEAATLMGLPKDALGVPGSLVEPTPEEDP